MAVQIESRGLRHMMTVPISPEANVLLDQLALARHQSKAAFVRQVLREWLEKHDAENDEK